MKGKKIITTAMAAVMAALFWMAAFTSNAAGEGSITADSVSVSVELGKTAAVDISYADIALGFGDLGTVSSDSGIAITALEDLGGGRARLYVAGLSTGTAVVAVYRVSNVAVAAYVTVYSGMADAGESFTQTDGFQLTTVYDDRVVNYPALLTGKNGAQLAVSGMWVERKSGIDILKLTGTIYDSGSETSGMYTFYTQFYDAAGTLLKRQGFYIRSAQTGNVLTLEWAIPENCAGIVVE